MPVIGSMSVNIVAVTDKFTAGIAKARSSIANFASNISKVEALVTGVAAGAFAKMAKDVIDMGDAIYDATQKLNIGASALGALHFAAEQSGGSVESMDRALQFLNKNMGLASQGNQSAIDTFSRLGLNVSALVKLKSDEAFLAVADAINKLGTAADQAAAAQQVFGKGGAEMLPVIRAGTDAIIQLGIEAQKTGSLLTDDQAMAMNNASDSIKTLTASWQGLKIELVQGFVPAISWVVDKLAGAMRIFRNLQLAIQHATLQIQGLFQDTQSDLAATAKQWEAINAPSAGPLGKPTGVTAGTATFTDKKAEEKATAENTKIIAEQMKLLNQNAKLGRATSQADLDAVKVKIAGVR